jgi:hypothetical protein
MRKFLTFLLFWSLVGFANAQVTYTATVGNYASVVDFTSCPGGETCTNYTTAMRQSGSFTVATALAPNLPVSDITASVTSYSFSDGINTYSSANPSDRLYEIYVATDGAGSITFAGIEVLKWLSGTSPHNAGDKLAYMGFGNVSINNVTCGGVGVSASGIADACMVFGDEPNGISQASSPGVSWAQSTISQPASIPTMSEWAMIMMASLMAMFAFTRMRRQ